MCRLFAVRASRPTRFGGSLLSAPHSLVTQSCCDREEKACHQDGWGIGYYEDGEVRRVRSTKAAAGDPEYKKLAESVAAQTLVAHVRRASSGSIAIQNSHPFTSGRWAFAHNGNLGGFAAGRDQLLSQIPSQLRDRIEGQTDSEHAFFFVLAAVEKATGTLDRIRDPRAAARAMAGAIDELSRLFPGNDKEPSQFNFVLTDGQTLLASRWGHSLSWLTRHGTSSGSPDEPMDGATAVVVASEPTSSERWQEVPERALLWVAPDFGTELIRLSGHAA